MMRAKTPLSERLIAEWHPIKNDKVSIQLAKRYQRWWWRCSQGHEWQASIKNRMHRGSNCPFCMTDSLRGRPNTPKTPISDPNLIAEWHPTKNPCRAEEVSFGSQIKYWWRCTEGHEWQAQPLNRVYSNSKCPYCSGKLPTAETCLETVNPNLAKEWHPKNKLTPQDVLPQSNKKVYWICPKGHEWQSTPNSRHGSGNGCPNCLASKGEEWVKQSLIRLSVTYRRQFPLKIRDWRNPLRFDFAIAVGTARGLIEYQGEQHYHPIKFWGGESTMIATQKRDAIKREACRRLGVPLLEIPYWDFANIGSLVGEFVGMLRQDQTPLVLTMPSET